MPGCSCTSEGAMHGDLNLCMNSKVGDGWQSFYPYTRPFRLLLSIERELATVSFTTQNWSIVGVLTEQMQEVVTTGWMHVLTPNTAPLSSCTTFLIFQWGCGLAKSGRAHVQLKNEGHINLEVALSSEVRKFLTSWHTSQDMRLYELS